MTRQVRHDPKAGGRMLNAALVFGAAMLGFFVSLGWFVLAAENGWHGWVRDVPETAVGFFCLAVLAATGYVFVARIRLGRYRCPKCRARLPRVPEAEVGRKVRYRCTACGIDWDTGWAETDNTD
jgi:hypothetical protein